MKSLRMIAAAAVLVLAGMMGFAALDSNEAYAACTCPVQGQTCTNSIAECGMSQIKEGKEENLMPVVKTAINVVLGIVGVVAVAVIIIGGISFITSQGDTSKVAKARNTILYGVVGLVVALLAFAIVNFVLGSVFGGGTTTTPEPGKEQGP